MRRLRKEKLLPPSLVVLLFALLLASLQHLLAQEPKLPPSTPSGYSDLEDVARERQRIAQEAKERWSEFQGNMTKVFRQVDEFDSRSDVTVKEKGEAWRRFLADFSADNPFSGEDDYWRVHALLELERLLGKDSISRRSFVLTSGDTARDTTSSQLWTRRDQGGPHGWHEAKLLCDDLNLGGRSDWRIPRLDELIYLLDLERVDPPMDLELDIPISIVAPFYSSISVVWSSTSVGEANRHFGALFTYGRTIILYEDRSQAGVLCVSDAD
jgi:hypothetical protein